MSSLTNTSNSNYLSQLIKAGSDAMSNLYYMKFEGLENLSNSVTEQDIVVRTSTFTPPQASQAVSSERNFMTMDVVMPAPMIEIEKTFSFHLRVDSNYKIYQAIMKQQQDILNGSIGFASNSLTGSTRKLFTVQVFVPKKSMESEYNYDSDNYFYNKKKLYTFHNCWVSKVSGLDFAYGSAEAQELDVEVTFTHMEDPMYYAINGDN